MTNQWHTAEGLVTVKCEVTQIAGNCNNPANYMSRWSDRKKDRSKQEPKKKSPAKKQIF